jgi:DNA modification methylase
LQEQNAFVIHCGDALEVLKTLPSESIHCCITSPPYYGLRDYGVEGQIGLEETPEQYVDNLVCVFREVRRVLRDDGTLWVNIGDSYAANRTYQVPEGCKPKDLIGIPWMLAFALRKDGWYLRSEIIWHKPNPMPESVKDRPTRAHEQIFLLSKSEKYFYNQDSIREPMTTKPQRRFTKTAFSDQGTTRSDRKPSMSYRYDGVMPGNPLGRNKRSVWTMNTSSYKGAHFAVFTPELPRTCLLAGCPEGGVVLDPFSGAATTGIVAIQHGRKYVGIELKPEYIKLSNERYENEKQAMV